MRFAPGWLLILLLAFASPSAAQDAQVSPAAEGLESTAEDAPKPTAPEPAPAPTLSLRIEEPDHAELLALDARYNTLRNERPGLVAPAVCAAVGAGVTAISGFAALMVWMVNIGSIYGDYENGYFGEGDAADRNNPDRKAVLALTTLAAAGLPVALSGLLWTGMRFRARRPYNTEMKTIRIRRKQLLENLRYESSIQGERFSVSLKARF